ncbi:flagellar hook-associated protein FlgK [Hydrogenophaga sp.]|uniref:flagellar hook-associated protein FlgK n=1 Tax=Hydrogenophaga sp. TaxID=1904254 RepID=UPI00272227C7|nr:flagellar hook-associated protein FlgK [Hydrogenophaga sp.]MDO8905479.1 flagellar hook-associated protein FlgK [Hydrogenophaga sp.]
MSSLNIGANALTTNLAALQVIGHNIANVNTVGYSRQNVQLETAGYQKFGNGYFGKGVNIATVERSHDAYLTREAQITSAIAAADAVRYSRLQQMESAFPLGEAGLGSALNSMLNAWGDVSSSPSDLTARTVVIARAEEFTSRLRNTAGQLDSLRNSTYQQVEGATAVVNRLASDLAKVNQRIIETQGGTHTPNDLFDQRDQLVREINQYVQTSSVAGEGGSINLFVGGSQPLVLGQNAQRLTVGRDSADPSRVQVLFTQAGISSPIADANLGGGELAGLVRFMNQDLTAVENQLGRLALATASSVNSQHTLGVDLQGNPGTDFFVPPANATAQGSSTNTGNAAISTSVSDPTALMASDYEIRFEAGGVNIIRLSDGTSIVPPGAPPSLPAVIDGLTFGQTGAGNVGDRFVIRPFAAVARNIQLAIGSPDRLAAASPVQVVPGMGNSTGLSIEGLYAVSGSPSLTTPVTLTFQADGTFNDDAVPPVNYNFSPGVPIEINGWSLTLRGTPTAGDSFTVSAAPLGSVAQNSGNAKGVLAMRDRPTFEGIALADGYISLFSELGTQVQGARFAAEFSANIAKGAETARTNVSGVNLDEEAARMLQFQQAYQASAKFLQVAQSTFDSLLQAVGR